MDQGADVAQVCLKTLCLSYVAVIIEIDTVSLHGMMLDISYLACGWQGEPIVWCVFAKEEREACMLRLAWVSKIKTWVLPRGLAQQLWFLSLGTKEMKSSDNKTFSGHFDFIVENILVPSKSNMLNREVTILNFTLARASHSECSGWNCLLISYRFQQNKTVWISKFSFGTM